jgi:hypothetical protein
MENYFNRPEVSNSDLSALKKQIYGGDDFDPTEAYRFGSLIDALITEPKKVNSRKRTVEGLGGFSNEDFEKAREMKRAFMRDPLASMMIKNCSPQNVMSFHGMKFDYPTPFTLDVRCKWDIWMGEQNWGGDIKSTVATTEEQFYNACMHFDYDRQRFWYMNIAEALTGKPVERDILIGISKKNFKVFKIPIQKGDAFWQSGKEKATELAFQWWLRFGNI